MSPLTDKSVSLGSRLRLAREQAGLSQGQVAKIMQIHRPTVSEMEAGRRKVSAEEISAFSKIYDVSVTWLVGDKDSSEENDRVELAARELAKLKPQDLEKVLNLLSALRDDDDGKS